MKNQTNYDLIILFSGGADSVMMFDLAVNKMNLNPIFLMIDYDQLHKEELDHAHQFLNFQNFSQHSQKVCIKNLLIDSGLTGTGKLNQYENVHAFHVPSRNLMFVSIAASIAESNNIKTIWYGADLSDRINLFPDCYQEWIVKVNELLAINGSRPVQLEAPLAGLTKDSILAYLQINGYKADDIYSGYGELENNV